VGRKAEPHPLFFVSVTIKGLSFAISLLFAILAGELISVVAKGVTAAWSQLESNGLGEEEFEGVRRTTWRTHIKGEARKNRANATQPL
jgi:hypothetical protein